TRLDHLRLRHRQILSVAPEGTPARNRTGTLPRSMEARARWGIDWERVPWTLWTYVGIAVIDTAVLFARSSHARPAIFAVIQLALLVLPPTRRFFAEPP